MLDNKNFGGKKTKFFIGGVPPNTSQKIIATSLEEAIKKNNLPTCQIISYESFPGYGFITLIGQTPEDFIPYEEKAELWLIQQELIPKKEHLSSNT